MSAERLISADSHVAITQDAGQGAILDPKLHDEYDAAIVEFGRRMSGHGLDEDERGRSTSSSPHPSAGRPGYAEPARAPRRHGRGRRRRRGPLLRGERVPVPVPRGERVAGGDARVQRRDARAFGVGGPEAAGGQRADPDPRHRRRGQGGAPRRGARLSSRSSSRCSRASSACPTTTTSATTRSGRVIQEHGLPICLPHRAQHPARRPHGARPHADDAGSSCRAWRCRPPRRSA